MKPSQRHKISFFNLFRFVYGGQTSNSFLMWDSCCSTGRAVNYKTEGQWFDSRVLLTMCSVLGQDTETSASSVCSCPAKISPREHYGGLYCMFKPWLSSHVPPDYHAFTAHLSETEGADLVWCNFNAALVLLHAWFWRLSSRQAVSDALHRIAQVFISRTDDVISDVCRASGDIKLIFNDWHVHILIYLLCGKALFSQQGKVL